MPEVFFSCRFATRLRRSILSLPTRKNTSGTQGITKWHRPLKMALLVYKREIGVSVSCAATIWKSMNVSKLLAAANWISEKDGKECDLNNQGQVVQKVVNANPSELES